MNLERYRYSNSNDFKDYEFYSEGHKGRIKKIVRFEKMPGYEPPVYNLGFGDQNPYTGQVDDLAVSNNEDREIILATVANTIVEFSNHHGNHYIYAKGSTPVRTRLYQMSISSLWEEINRDFEVYGLRNGDWQEFETNSINYDAFLVRKR